MIMIISDTIPYILQLKAVYQSSKINLIYKTLQRSMWHNGTITMWRCPSTFKHKMPKYIWTKSLMAVKF